MGLWCTHASQWLCWWHGWLSPGVCLGHGLRKISEAWTVPTPPHLPPPVLEDGLAPSTHCSWGRWTIQPVPSPGWSYEKSKGQSLQGREGQSPTTPPTSSSLTLWASASLTYKMRMMLWKWDEIRGSKTSGGAWNRAGTEHICLLFLTFKEGIVHLGTHPPWYKLVKFTGEAPTCQWTFRSRLMRAISIGVIHSLTYTHVCTYVFNSRLTEESHRAGTGPCGLACALGV